MIEEIVDNLNWELWGSLGEDNVNHCFCYTKLGFTQAISLHLNYDNFSIKINLWNDENEDRKFLENKNEYEDLQKFILKKYSKVIKEMINIKKNLCK